MRLGVITRAWKECQLQYGRTVDPNYRSRTAERWARDLQAALWDYVAGVWNFRNSAVHGADKDSARKIRTDAICDTVHQLQAQPPDVGQEAAHLFREDGIDRKSQHYMRHWIRAVQTAAAAETVRKSNRQVMQNAIAAVRESQREPAEARSVVQSSIRNYFRRSPDPPLRTIAEHQCPGKQDQGPPANYRMMIPRLRIPSQRDLIQDSTEQQ